MDWLFGRKKCEGKVEEAREVTQVVDGFVFVPTTNDSQYPHYPSLPNMPAQAASSVPSQPSSMYPSTMNNPKRNTIQTNPLDSVPFKLSSQLDRNSSKSLSSDVRNIGQFLSNIQRSLDSSELNYDFRLERSVLKETNAFNGYCVN